MSKIPLDIHSLKKERSLYLQEQANAFVPNSLGDYLRLADEE